MPKTVSCNSFYMFMTDTKRRLEARGERFPRGMEDVVPIAADLWERMTQEQKNVYKEKATEFKKSEEFSQHKKEMKARLPKSMRADTSRRSQQPRPAAEQEFVEPVAYIFPSDDEDAVEEFRKKHIKDRKEILDAWRWNMGDKPDAVYDMKVYVLSFIAHCRTGSYAYFPAEVGIVELSLRDGIIRAYSKIIGPHSLPPKVVDLAKENFETHKIPFAEPVAGMCNDYARVLDEILRFCHPAKNMRRLYCISKEFNTVQGCVNFLQTRAKLVEIKAERINRVEDLFILLCEWREKSCAPAEWRKFNDCDSLTESAPFDRRPDFLCEYHSSLDGVHRCALATAKQASYYLLARVRSHYMLPNTERHRPPPLPGATNIDPTEQLARVVRDLPLVALPTKNEKTESTPTSNEAAGLSHRVPAMPDHKPRDVGMPSTLPMHLRGKGFVVPDSWKDANAKLEEQKRMNEEKHEQKRKDRGSTSTSVVGALSTAGRTSVSQSAATREAAAAATRPTNIVWNQNKSIRDKIYASANLAARRQGGGGSNANAHHTAAGQQQQQGGNNGADAFEKSVEPKRKQ